tara:strand:+ start:169 stop:552 length:384 start_codon:yes stop_codon:yes gene_type:complete
MKQALNKQRGKQMQNFRIGISHRNRQSVPNTLFKYSSAEELAGYLKITAPEYDQAEKFIKLVGDRRQEADYVDAFGDPLCTRISGVENTEDLTGLFIHMKDCWHYSDDGIYWEPVDIEFREHLEKVA